MGPAAAASSMASVGFQAAATMTKAQGESVADQYKADQLDRAAEYGELKAVQTNAQLTRNLTMTLGNIDAVRAANRTDPTSPTGAAVRDMTESIGTTQKNITVANIENQAREDEAGAAYMRQASNTALLGGELSTVGTLLSAGKNIPMGTG